MDDSPLPNCPSRDTVVTEPPRRPPQSLSSGHSALHCLLASGQSLEGAISGHQSWAVLCRYRCRLLLAEIPKGTNRHAEFKHCLHRKKTEEAALGTSSQEKKNRAATH